MADIYPPSPRRVPDGLAHPHAEYQTQATMVLMALLMFALLYFLGLVFSLGLPILCLFFSPVLAAILALPCMLLFFFLIKGFFQKTYPEKTFRVELLPEEHPRLFEFLERLCEETDAPLPHRVFLSPEVNAAVFYDNDTVWGLIFPPPKNLLIGVPLVNALNLSEFKAVLAHEFGHFSQKSMLLHRYIYSANRIIGDVVFNRDWYDHLVLSMYHAPDNGFLNMIGGVGYGSMWAFRKAMEGYLYLINYLGAGLSREMEFNADLVAVRVTGSDAIVNALSRVDFIAESFGQALEDLKAAGDHGLYTDDLFHHQNHAAAYLRKKRKNPRLGEPPPLPEDEDLSPEVFDADDESVPEMWASHPPNYDREQNAKRIYLRCPIDERSPWLLFDDAEDLRLRLTWKYYRVVWDIDKDVEVTPARKVQAFIDEEHSETTYDPRYHGAYDNRPIRPGDIEDLLLEVRDSPWKPEVVRGMANKMYGPELQLRMKEIQTLREELERLRALERGDKMLEHDGTFRFRGKKYDEDDFKRLIKRTEKEYDEQLDWLADMDRRSFRLHMQMARELKASLAEELLSRYRFHMAAQGILIDLAVQRPMLEMALAVLSGAQGPMDYQMFASIRGSLIDTHDVMTRCISRADKLALPRLKNLKEGAKLGFFLMDVKLVKRLRPTATSITGKWVSKFLGQLGAIEDRIRRIHFKSLGALLALQEQIRERWLTEGASMDRLEEVEEEA